MSAQNCRADTFQCQRWRDRLKTACVEQLPPEEQTALWSHVQGCRHCFDVYTYTLYTDGHALIPQTPVGVSARAGHLAKRAFPRFRRLVLRRLRKHLTGTGARLLRLILCLCSLLCGVIFPASLGIAAVTPPPLAMHRTLTAPLLGATWVHTVAWSPNGLYIGVLWDNSTLQVLDANGSVRIFSTEVGWGNGLAWSPDSQLIAATGRTGNTVGIWSITTSAQWLYTEHTSLVTAIAWSPDRTHDLIASASNDGNVRIWNAHTRKTFFSFPDTTAGLNGITALAWSHDGQRLVLGDSNGHIQVWDVFAKKHIRDYSDHIKGGITSVSWSFNDVSIVSASNDGTARIWDVKKGAVDLSISPCSNMGPVLAAFWNPRNSTYLGLACYDGSVQIWRIAHQKDYVVSGEIEKYSQQDPTIGIFTISWSPLGDQLIAGGPGNIFGVALKEVR